MKKMVNSLLCSVMLLSSLSAPAVVLADELAPQPAVETRTQVEEKVSVQAVSENTLVFSDNDETIKFTVIDNNHFELTAADGTVSYGYVDSLGNVYLNGELVKSSENPTAYTVVEPVRGGTAFRSASQWIYLDTNYTNSYVQGNLQNVIVGLVSTVPMIGQVVGLASIIQAVLDAGSPMLYIKTVRYYKSGYQFYRYDRYFYSDPGYSRLVRSTSNVVQMW